MPRERYDISSKWLLRTQGKGALLVGGLKGVRRYRAMPGEIAQPRKYPVACCKCSWQGRRSRTTS
jgi:hypothetical protein